MVPVSSWGISLRNKLPRSKWDKLRKEIHEKNGLKCEICESTEKLHCHEHWEFDKATSTQQLAGLGTVCNMCHHVAHLGRSKQLAAEGHLDIKAVVDHFMKVNACDLKIFKKHEADAVKVWAETPPATAPPRSLRSGSLGPSSLRTAPSATNLCCSKNKCSTISSKRPSSVSGTVRSV